MVARSCVHGGFYYPSPSRPPPLSPALHDREPSDESIANSSPNEANHGIAENEWKKNPDRNLRRFYHNPNKYAVAEWNLHTSLANAIAPNEQMINGFLCRLLIMNAPASPPFPLPVAAYQLMDYDSMRTNGCAMRSALSETRHRPINGRARYGAKCTGGKHIETHTRHEARQPRPSLFLYEWWIRVFCRHCRWSSVTRCGSLLF